MQNQLKIELFFKSGGVKQKKSRCAANLGGVKQKKLTMNVNFFSVYPEAALTHHEYTDIKFIYLFIYYTHT